jgi:YVTN family beta-propeller protein
LSLSVDPPLGSELFGYRLDSLLGRGGMGVVYKAYDPRLKRNVALKLIAPELSGDARFRERFLAETELAASLEHPNVVPIHDAGEVDGQLYLAMRYVEGSDLKTVLQKDSPLEPGRALAICGQVAAALDVAHANRLVHRDAKPSNVLLDENEHVYLADFGLTKRVSETSVGPASERSLGTIDYVAPEQIRGHEVDGRADLYSLGCLLFECLSGEPPFRRASEAATLFAHLEEDPPASAGIDHVMQKALAKTPAERYQTGRELVDAAGAALGLRDVVVLRDRRRPLLLAAGGLLLAVAAALAAFFVSRGDGGPARPSTKPTLTPNTDVLQQIDPRTNKLAATLRLGSDPTGVAVGEGAVWTIHFDDNRISRIDPRTNSVAATGSAPGPREVTAGQGSVWVVNGDGRTVTQLDDRSAAQLNIVQVPISAELLASGAGAVWVGSPLTGTVARINPRSASVSESFLVPARRGTIKELAVGEGALWISSNDIVADQYRVFRVDPSTGKVVATIPIRLGAQGIDVGRGAVWVASPLGNTVSEIDPTTDRVVRTVRVGQDPIAVAVGEGAVWVTNYEDGTVSRIDPKRGRVVERIRVGPNPDRIAVGLGGVWVTVHPR